MWGEEELIESSRSFNINIKVVRLGFAMLMLKLTDPKIEIAIELSQGNLGS